MCFCSKVHKKLGREAGSLIVTLKVYPLWLIFSYYLRCELKNAATSLPHGCCPRTRPETLVVWPQRARTVIKGWSQGFAQCILKTCGHFQGMVGTELAAAWRESSNFSIFPFLFRANLELIKSPISQQFWS